LAKEDELEPEWRKRFERNIFNDSRRLAESAQSLANYLDGAADASATLGSPQEEVDGVLEDRGFIFELLEAEVAPQDVVASLIDEANLRSPQAAGLLRVVLQRYHQDASLLPMSALLNALDADADRTTGQGQLNPVRLAAWLRVPLEVVLRRLAHIPKDKAPFPMGLVICDASGALIYRKPVAGFDMPRVGAPCALWPMFRALNQPMQPLRAVVQQVGASRPAMRAFAVSTPVVTGDFDRPAIYEATMLIAADTTVPPSEAEKVGPSCRICSVAECAVRREASVLADTISAF
jgi:predicted transcriptional regulator